MLRLTTEWPTHVFAPTVDMGDSPIVDLSRLARTKGILFFDLAYIAADGDNRPSWCGMADRLVGAGDFDAALREQIDDLRAMGGDVIVSFGGPGARPLAEAITDVKQLKGAYRGVVDAYAVSRINFDLDGAALDDRAAVERRWQATAALVHELSNDGLPLEVWVTLPATKSGLSKAALDALRSAGKHGLYLDGVNLKTDAGAGPSPEAQPAAGSATIRAAINAYAQAAQVLARGADGDAAWTGIGITPAVGGNTSTGTPLTPNDARELVDFAQRHGLGMLGTWQTTRGLPEKHAQQGARPSGAGIEQAAAEIMEIFGEFTGSLRE